jgi:mannan endo-1,4-beta-mannosidase
MKKQLFASALLLLLITNTLFGQALQVSGRYLQDPTGANIILRGLNYPMIDEYGIPLNNTALVDARIDQVAMTGANCMRFSWYTNGTHYKDFLAAGASYGPGSLNGYLANGHLSHVLQYARQKGMITVLELHNFTGKSNYTHFQDTITAFWTSPAVVSLINANEKHLIINLANEFGYGASGTAQTSFKNNYINAITAIRATGIKVPIMIDAENYGQNSTSLTQIAGAILAADPLSNVIFSAHAYWDGYASTLPQIQTKLNEMQATNTCFILGEVANKQAGAPSYCGEIDITALYPILLNEACTRDIGWLAWDYSEDCEPTREMTNSGLFSGLTTWGLDVVNNPNFGLKFGPGNCKAQVLPPYNVALETTSLNLLRIAPNPAQDAIQIFGSDYEKVNVEIYDVTGKLMLQNEVKVAENMIIRNLISGTYMVRLTLDDKIEYQKLVVL